MVVVAATGNLDHVGLSISFTTSAVQIKTFAWASVRRRIRRPLVYLNALYSLLLQQLPDYLLLPYVISLGLLVCQRPALYPVAAATAQSQPWPSEQPSPFSLPLSRLVSLCTSASRNQGCIMPATYTRARLLRLRRPGLSESVAACDRRAACSRLKNST